MNELNFPARPLPRRPRAGCIGLLFKLAMIFGLGLAFLYAFTWVYAPWAYYLGGHYHAIPYWQGWGRVHVGTAGGDYVLFVRMEPTTRGSRMYPSSNLKGIAYLCAPSGERYRLKLGGSMAFHLPTNTIGQRIHIYANYWPTWTGQFITDHRPSISVYGTWADRAVVGDDQGSIARQFSADASLYRGHDPNRPWDRELAPVTLREGSYSEFEGACPAKK